MQIPTLEEELEQIVEDTTNVIEWAEHVRQQVTKALERLRSRATCGAVLKGDEGEEYRCALHPSHVTAESDHTDEMGLAQWPVKEGA